MAKRITKYYQECDFCHKEFEIISGSLDSITLPGRYVDTDGCQRKQWITADICPECKEKLREYLAKAVDIKEVAYGGTIIRWLDDEGENKGERETMAEYIDREAMLEQITRRESLMVGDKMISIDALREFIMNRPVADVKEVKHGHWIHYPECGVTKCSVCHRSVEECVEYPRCMFCGAKLNEEDENDQ